MQQDWMTKITLRFQNRDAWEKMIDGVVVPVILSLTWLLVAIAAQSLASVFGTPGLLVYALCLLAVSMLALQQSLTYRLSETRRAWYGIVGGFFAWAVVALSARFGTSLQPGLDSMILLMMVALIVLLLWKSVFPVGVRFFSLTFLLNWLVFIFASVQEGLSAFSPVFTLFYRATGIAAILVALLMISWILFQSRRRIERLRGALIVWILISLVVYIFFGSLF